MATCTPIAPDTSSRAPSATVLRPAPAFTLTAIWPPVAKVVELPSNSTLPPETISMRDWSRRSSSLERLSNTPAAAVRRARSCTAESAIRALR